MCYPSRPLGFLNAQKLAFPKYCSSRGLPAAASSQSLQLLPGFRVSAFSCGAQKDLCLYAIPGNSLSPQIQSRQIHLRRGIA